LALHPDNARLQKLAARCDRLEGGETQVSPQVSAVETQSLGSVASARCRKLRVLLARHPDNARLQRLVASRCPPSGGGQEPSATPPSAAETHPPSPAPADQVQPGTTPGPAEKRRPLSREEAAAIDEQLIP